MCLTPALPARSHLILLLASKGAFALFFGWPPWAEKREEKVVGDVTLWTCGKRKLFIQIQKDSSKQARMWLVQQVTTTSLLLTRLKLLVTGKWSKPNLVDWCWQKVNLWEEQTGGGEWLLVSEVWLDKNGGGWWWLPTVGWWLRLPSSIWLSTISLAGTLLGHFRKSLRKIKHSTSLTPLFFSCHLFHVTESVGECDFSIGHMVVVVSHRIRLSISIFW